MDDYQAIYDAVRSKIGNGDIGSAVESAIRDANVGHYVQMAMENISQAAHEHMRPSAVFKPKIFLDGDEWCALLGENLQEGIAGFGKTPDRAAHAFDRAWHETGTPNDKP